MAYPWRDLIRFLSQTSGDHILILWHSFQNKRNKNIQRIFPQCSFTWQTVTLQQSISSVRRVSMLAYHMCHEQHHAQTTTAEVVGMGAQVLPCLWLSSYQLRKDMQQSGKHGEVTHSVVNSSCMWVRPQASLLILIHTLGSFPGLLRT